MLVLESALGTTTTVELHEFSKQDYPYVRICVAQDEVSMLYKDSLREALELFYAISVNGSVPNACAELRNTYIVVKSHHAMYGHAHMGPEYLGGTRLAEDVPPDIRKALHDVGAITVRTTHPATYDYYMRVLCNSLGVDAPVLLVKSSDQGLAFPEYWRTRSPHREEIVRVKGKRVSALPDETSPQALARLVRLLGEQ